MASRGDTQNLRLIKFADSPGASPGNNILYSNGSVLLFNGTQLASSGNLFPVLSTDIVTPLTQPGITFTSNIILRQSATSSQGVAGQGFQYLADGRLFFNEAEVAGRSNLIPILTANLITSQSSNIQILSNLNVSNSLIISDSNVVIASNNLVFSNANPTLLYNAASLNILSTNYGGVLKVYGNSAQSNVWLVSGDPNNAYGADVSNFSFVSKGDATSNTNYHAIAKLSVTQSDTLNSSGGGGTLSLRTRDPSKTASTDKGDTDTQVTMLSCNTSVSGNTVVLGPGGDSDNVYVGIGIVNPVNKFQVYGAGKTVFAVDTVNSQAIIGAGVALNFTDQITITGASSNRLEIGTSGAGTNSTALGILAGAAGNDSTAVGTGAGQTTQSARAVALGYQAGRTSQGVNSIAVGYQAGQSNQSANSIAIGHLSGQTSQGQLSVAIGELSGFLNQGSSSIGIGDSSAYASQGAQSVAIGKSAGQNSQGSQSLAIGFQAGQFSQSIRSVSLGLSAGQSFQGSQSMAVGYQAGQSTQGVQALAIGYQAGQTSQGSLAVAIGANAGNSTQLQEAVAIGTDAGRSSQGIRSIAIGTGAGQVTQAGNAVAIGFQAGQSNQSNSSIAIGAQAGYASFVGASNTVAIGQFSGRTNQGIGAVSIGSESGFTTQSSNSVAIGIQSGYSNQSNSAVAIGGLAGYYVQGSQSVAIGDLSGQSNQSAQSVAIGGLSGTTEQSQGAIAIGYQAGQSLQGQGAVAIGYQTGVNNQGSFSIGIGYQANPNLTSTIVLNATGGTLTPQSGQSFFVKPIRDSGTTEFAKVLSYNDNTGEVYKHTSIITSPQTVGIGNSAPSNLLCVGLNTWFVEPSVSSNLINTTGNVSANTYYGSAIQLSNIAGASSNGIHGNGASIPVITVDITGRITSISNTAITQFGTLQQVTSTGNTSSTTIVLTNATNSLVAAGTVGVGNLVPSNLLCVGTRTYMTATHANALVTTGNVVASHYHGNAAFLRSTVSVPDGTYGSAAFVPSFTVSQGRITNVTLQGVTGSQTLDVTVGLGNDASRVIKISNSISLTTTGSVGIANVAPDANLLCIGANTWVSPTDIYTFGNVAANNFIITSNIVQVGLQAGLVGQGANTIAIGSYAGRNGQNAFAVSIGNLAGQSGQYSSAISIGTNAGQLNQRANAITIGSLSGQTGQNTFAIAIGDVAGQSGQFLSAIAIGQGAGQLNQRANAITIGAFSGQSGQNAYAISMGDFAGQSGQYEAAVAIGRGAGQSNQGSSAVAVGYLAGQSVQGNNSIAIGNQAGSSTAGSIMLNASGVAKNTAVAGFHVFPVRYSTATSNVITYNSSTGEIGDSGMTTLASTLKFTGAYIYSNSSVNPIRTSNNFGFYTNGTTETVINSGAAGYINFKFNDVRRMFLGPGGDLVVAGGDGSCLGLGDRNVTTSIWTLYAAGGASSIFRIYYNSADRFFLDGSGNLTTTGNISNGTVQMLGRTFTCTSDSSKYAVYCDLNETYFNAGGTIYFRIGNNGTNRGFINSGEAWFETQLRSRIIYSENYFSAVNGFRMYGSQLQRGTGAENDFGNVAIYWGDSNLNLYARANATIFLRINNAERFWTNNTESYAYGQMRSAYIRSDGGMYAAGMYETWGGSAGYLVGSRNNYYSYMIYSAWGQLFFFSYQNNYESHRFHDWGGAARRDSYSYWDGWSDSNMKTDIIDANLDICYENIKNMNLKKFRYKDEIESIDKTDKYRLGFIAQDLQKIFPKSVKANTIKEGKFLSLNLDQLNYTLYGAVQKIMKNMDTKDSQISSLETQLSITDSRVSETLVHLSNTNTQLVQTSSQLASTQTQLSETRTQLTSTQTQLTSTQSQLAETNSNLSSTQSQLAETRTQLSSTQSQLTITKNELSSVKSQLSSTQTQLSETDSNLSSTQSQLSETKQDLTQTQSQLTETKQELTDLKNSTKRGSVALFNGTATVSVTPGANPQLFLQPRMSFDRVIGEIVGNQIHITCEKIQSTATIDWLIVSG